MTLVLTELSALGVAMATDSAITYTDPTSGRSFAIPGKSQKLHTVAGVDAGISCWGLGLIDGMQTHDWIGNFIRRLDPQPATLTALAQALASELNKTLGRSSDGRPTGGFHVAGFLEDEEGPAPSLYHVHNGPSKELEARGQTIDPHLFNANHDVPPSRTRVAIARGESLLARNGDYQLYAQLSERLEAFFKELRPSGIIIPMSTALRDRADYLVFSIRTIAEMYRLSNLVRGIGGHIPFLTISPAGLDSEGIRYV